ncbi:MAG: SRPBCC domain-containing protein [Planctomycetia bacterium]|nr:SRPBCC domain-containing protein [Planctomycetia bacterium]
MHVEFRAECRCTPWELWRFLDETEKQKLWMTTLLEITTTSQLPRAVGTTFDMRVREGRRIARYEGRINAYDPPRHLGVSFWGGALSRGVVMQVDYRLADLGSRTRLEYYALIDTEPLSGPIKLAIPIARVFMFFQLRYFMRNLKRLAEASARSEATRRTPARAPG